MHFLIIFLQISSEKFLNAEKENGKWFSTCCCLKANLNMHELEMVWKSLWFSSDRDISEIEMIVTMTSIQELDGWPWPRSLWWSESILDGIESNWPAGASVMSGINIKKLSAARAEGLYVWLIKCGGKIGTGQETLCCCPDRYLGGFYIFNPTLGGFTSATIFNPAFVGDGFRF